MGKRNKNTRNAIIREVIEYSIETIVVFIMFINLFVMYCIF